MSKTSGHYGRKKMFETIKSKYYWPSLKTDIDEFVKNCPLCRYNKNDKKTKQPMIETRNGSSPFEIIELDLMGPLPVDKAENKYILSMHCKFSRFIVAVPISDKRSETVGKAFVDNFICKFGIPKAIVTDRGKEFTSELFGNVCGILGISQLRTTAYHHESMGLTEVSHKHLGEFLRINAKEQNNWGSWLIFGALHITPQYTQTSGTARSRLFLEKYVGRQVL